MVYELILNIWILSLTILGLWQKNLKDEIIFSHIYFGHNGV